MSSQLNIQKIDDITLLKEKIIKVDTLFTLMNEKQAKIKVLESKQKKILHKNTILCARNNELLNEISRVQKESETSTDKYQQELFQETQKVSMLEETIETIKKKNKLQYENYKKILSKYKHRLRKYSLQKNIIEKNNSCQIKKLHRTIKVLRSKLKTLRVNSTEKNKENISMEEQKDKELMQQLDMEIVEPVKELEIELIDQLEKNLDMELCELDKNLDIDTLLEEMITMPTLFQRFLESPIQMQNVQTQTTRSNVTRPVQTTKILLNSQMCQTDSLGGLSLIKQNLTYQNSSSVSLGIQCFLDKQNYHHVGSNSQEDKSCQTRVNHAIKSTQTGSLLSNEICTQTKSSGPEKFEQTKITLKRAVDALKRSKATFTISNGRLIHYSKQAMSSANNESLISMNVYRRLKKYIDKSYGFLNQKKSKRNSHVLTEIKQLERSRELMQLCRLGLAKFSNNSDTESSGYDCRNDRDRWNNSDLKSNTGTMTPSGDSGVFSENELHTFKKHKRRKAMHDDIEDIFNECILPQALSPLDEDFVDGMSEQSSNCNNLASNHGNSEFSEPNCSEIIEGSSQEEAEGLNLPEKEKVIEISSGKKNKKNKTTDRLALLRRKIKNCNKVNILRMNPNHEPDNSENYCKKRLVQCKKQESKELGKSIKFKVLQTQVSDGRISFEDNSQIHKETSKELIDDSNIGCDLNLNINLNSIQSEEFVQESEIVELSTHKPEKSISSEETNEISLTLPSIDVEREHENSLVIADMQQADCINNSDFESITTPKKQKTIDSLQFANEKTPDDKIESIKKQKRLTANNILSILNAIDNSSPTNSSSPTKSLLISPPLPSGLRRSPRIAARSPPKPETKRNYKRKSRNLAHEEIIDKDPVDKVPEVTNDHLEENLIEKNTATLKENILGKSQENSASSVYNNKILEQFELETQNMEILKTFDEETRSEIEACKHISFYQTNNSNLSNESGDDSNNQRKNQNLPQKQLSEEQQQQHENLLDKQNSKVIDTNVLTTRSGKVFKRSVVRPIENSPKRGIKRKLSHCEEETITPQLNEETIVESNDSINAKENDKRIEIEQNENIIQTPAKSKLVKSVINEEFNRMKKLCIANKKKILEFKPIEKIIESDNSISEDICSSPSSLQSNGSPEASSPIVLNILSEHNYSKMNSDVFKIAPSTSRIDNSKDFQHNKENSSECESETCSTCTDSSDDCEEIVKPAKSKFIKTDSGNTSNNTYIGCVYKFPKVKKILDHIIWMRGNKKDCSQELNCLKRMQIIVLVSYILHYIKFDQSEIDKPPDTQGSREPLLTIPQKVIIGILLRLENETSKTYISLLIDEIEKFILFNTETTRNYPEELQTLTRFYTVLCRLQQKKSKIRIFIADLLYFKNNNKFDIIYTIITNWMNIVPIYKQEEACGLIRVLIYVCQTHKKIPGIEDCSGVLIGLLTSYYKYPSDPEKIDDLMMSLIESYICWGHIELEAAILTLGNYASVQFVSDNIKLIGELCVVSQEREIIVNLFTVITRLMGRLPKNFKAKLDDYISDLYSRLEEKHDSKFVTEVKNLFIMGNR